MRITISFDSALVRRGLQDLQAEVPLIGRRKIYDAMNRITRRMEEYPPEPEGTSRTEYHPVLGRIIVTNRHRYERTGRLGRSWQVESLDNGYSISNRASNKYGTEYAPYVVGDAYGTSQAWMHVGRWQLFRDVADDEISTWPDEVADEVNMVARRAGL